LYLGVTGQPGVDYPALTSIPTTSFSCRGLRGGYYADLETNCQVGDIDITYDATARFEQKSTRIDAQSGDCYTVTDYGNSNIFRMSVKNMYIHAK